jgi:hypothetical protein
MIYELNKKKAATPILMVGFSIMNDKPPPSMNSAINGRVTRSHLRLPIVSILLTAGSANKKLIAPIESNRQFGKL